MISPLGCTVGGCGSDPPLVGAGGFVEGGAEGVVFGGGAELAGTPVAGAGVAGGILVGGASVIGPEVMGPDVIGPEVTGAARRE
jgi:hypothetical protein